MKKSTLLSLATAGAIVVTSAGTFAVWDTLSATATSNEVSLGNPVTVAVATDTFSSSVLSELKSDDIAIGTEIMKGDVTFTIDEGRFSEADLELSVTPTVVVTNGNGVSTSDFDVVATEDTTIKGKYNVVVKAKNALSSTNAAGATVKVEVTGTVTKATAP